MNTQSFTKLHWKLGAVLGCLVCLAPLAGRLAAEPDPGTNPQGLPITPVVLGSIIPLVRETGNVSLSVDGLGTNSAGGGVIQVEKPAGATVRKAYLAAASTGFTGRTLNNGDVRIDGAGVNWDLSTPSGIFSRNHWADVTAMVKPKIDAAPAGRVDFLITEVGTFGIDGEILAVIFDDPNQTTTNTVALLFGAQAVNGDRFAVSLADPIDKSNPNVAVDMSLGISFSFQGTTQISRVTVNGTRLSSSAGGQDDGLASNGALLTVGGLDDSNANPPNAFAGPANNTRFDDELYNLLPFVNTGDSTITVDTINPSQDDNIFFAAFFFGNAAALVGEGITLSPLTATNPVGTTHTVTARIQDTNGNPVANRDVDFEILRGPHAGRTGSGRTDSTGRTTFTYTGAAAGTDVLVARFLNSREEEVESNQATKTWEASNGPPVLAAVGDRTVNEETELKIVLSATDPDNDALTFAAPTLPPGATFNAATRTFCWTPTEAQGPGDYAATFRVVENTTEQLSDEETINICVNEVNRPPAAAILLASATASTAAGDPCTAAPDLIQATGQASDPDEPANSLTYQWCIDGAPAAQTPTPQPVPAGGVPALSQQVPHQPHHTYQIALKVFDNFEAGPKRVGQPLSDTATASRTVNNLPPVAFEFSWHRTGDCDETTDTPLEGAYPARKSLVAAPACGTEAAPGNFLTATGAACDPDGDPIRFRFVLDGDVHPPNPIITARTLGAVFQTAKLDRARLTRDIPVHRLHLLVDDSPNSAGPPAAETAFTPLSDSTDAIQVVDPREELRLELREELARHGFAIPAGADPIQVFQAWLGPKLAMADADLAAAAGRAGFSLPSGFKLRTDGWTQGPPPAGALAPEAEMRGEYAALLLNTQCGYLNRDDFVNLVVPVSPRTFLESDARSGKVQGVDFCFPRLDPVRPDPDEFDLPPQLFLADQTLPMLRNNALVSLGFTPPAQPGQPPLTAEILLRATLNLSDTARLFNTQAGFVNSSVAGSSGFRHRPDTPQARVHSAANDGTTTPVVCWSFSDPHCDANLHRQARAEVTVDGGTPVVITDGRMHLALAGLAPGEHTVCVRVFDALGFGSLPRLVRFRVAHPPEPI